MSGQIHAVSIPLLHRCKDPLSGIPSYSYFIIEFLQISFISASYFILSIGETAKNTVNFSHILVVYVIILLNIVGGKKTLRIVSYSALPQSCP